MMKLRTLALIAVAALVLAACGSGDDTSTEPTEAATTATTAAAETPSDEAMSDDEMSDDEMSDDERSDDEMSDDEMSDDEMSDDERSDDEMSDGTGALALDVTDLPVLDGGLHYEGWAIIDGAPVSTGKFVVADGTATDLDGNAVTGHGHGVELENATTLVVTIEPAGDVDDVPADTHIVAGDIVDGGAELTVAHGAALGSDFTDAAGRYVLATPTDDDASNNLAGVWFLTLPGPEAGLSLPTLPAGWVYEGWAVIDGQPVSTGRFTDVAAADDSAVFSGPNSGPNYPGEDFLINAPDGLEFPANLQGATVVVSIEPDPDDGDAPFAFKPLVGEVPADAEPEPTAYELGQNLVFPTVTATIAG